MIVSYYVNLIIILISYPILSWNLVTQKWNIIVKYPAIFQYTVCRNDSLRNYKDEAKIKPSEKALAMPGQKSYLAPYRLINRRSQRVLARISVCYETWSRTGWHHRFLTGWSKHRLGLSQSQYIVRPIGNFHQIGATDSSFAAHSYGRQYEGKSPFKKWTGPKTIWWNVWHLNISKPSVIQFFVHVTNCFYFHFIKILSLGKLICAQYWRLISGSRVDHQR